MPKKRELELDEAARRTLQEMRDHHRKPYLRERAAALLKIADGASVNWVAQHGLLKPRHPDRVTEWLNRYESKGLGGLYIRPGRGRKPAFRPAEHTQIREQVLAVLRQSPHDYDIAQTRWTLDTLLAALTMIQLGSRAGLGQVLKRLHIRYRQGWQYQVSPDPWATEKLAWIDAILQRAAVHPELIVVLWLDELTFYRLPSPAPQWSDGQTPRGPKAVVTPGPNTQGRIGAVLNHFTGQVCYLLRSKCGVKQLCQLYQMVRQVYPEAEEIYVIQDCWPNHFLPTVVQTAEQLGIALVPLPTYSSWRNPIEKLWRWLKQSVIHMHRWADDWPRLKQEVRCFLDRLTLPNSDALRYVGLPY